MKKHIKLLVVLGIILVGSFSFYLFKGYKKYTVVYENNKIKPSSSGIAMMLETSAGSGNYEMTTRSEWPTEGYVFNANLSKCENGSELSWDNENKKVLMSGNVSDKCYVYFDVIQVLLADYIKSLYTGTQGENSIYYHDASLTNGAGDNSYRYAGASDQVNNYVCFGTKTTPCPTDNLYRIIGVFDNKVGENQTEQRVKLIKSTSVGDKQWNGTNDNTWSASILNTYLNNEFINTFDETTKGKIADTTWKVGGFSDSKQPAKAVYQNEINSSPSVNNKIGLMYVSDYGFAAAPSAWTANLNTYNGEAIKNVNWLYTGLYDYEWTISRVAGSSFVAFAVFSSGSVGGNGVNDIAYAVRPSFNLLSSITYVSGSGSANDPIVIN